MAAEGVIVLWSFLMLYPVPVSGGKAEGCECSEATVFTDFPLDVPTDVCCLNYSGSTFGHVSWAAFSSSTKLQILDLSYCNISSIDYKATEGKAFFLRELYLGYNRLTSLPADFLTNAGDLQMLDLRMNLLERLPEGFLQNSDRLLVLNLRGNQLSSFPSSMLRPSLQNLELSENPWACTCSLVEELQKSRHDNISSQETLVGNLTCAAPSSLAGRTVWSVQVSDVCRLPGLTALFILLPLLLLVGLVLCWCCGRKEKRKEVPTFGMAHKKAHSNRSGQGPRVTKAVEATLPCETSKDAMLKNQLMLRPTSTLLGSTRDIYEEVEIKLGSVDSLARPPSSAASTEEGTIKRESQGLGSKQDLETVSVTEVMKDSADREKAYLTQSTEYYSLVPGIEIEDSDHDRKQEKTDLIEVELAL
ncbi:leucine-rich repeat-containing protein 26 [Chanos chanos]|uniref:Leucine-rich repeat-containing protein 26 n=1 Tax=Chanos chanos TaxID=29144 RepID=A0A6J2VA31_CHACN|nr:leucine-rich repeat-containing protein 26-like [Chanos chanos]